MIFIGAHDPWVFLMAHHVCPLHPQRKTTISHWKRRHFMNLVKASGKPRRWLRRCPLSLTVTSRSGAKKTWNIDLAKTRSNAYVYRYSAHLIRSISEIFRAWISHHMLLAYLTNLDFVIHYVLQEIAPLTLTFCSKSPI